MVSGTQYFPRRASSENGLVLKDRGYLLGKAAQKTDLRNIGNWGKNMGAKFFPALNVLPTPK